MKRLLFLTILMTSAMLGVTQVAVNTDGSAADNSAMLDVKSTSKGMLVPRMTAGQRNAISNPATGLLIFCTDNNQYYSNKGTPASPTWMMVSSQWISNGSNIYFSGGNVAIGTNDPPAQKLHVSGKIVAEVGSMTSAYYRFGDGTENTGLSSPNFNTLAFINNGVQSGHFDASGRLRIGTGTPASSAQLDVSSTSRGFLPPRMTNAQMNAIASPQAGLIVYNTSLKTLFWYDGTAWKTMTMNNDGESCGTISYGGQTYNTVIIGSQCWMKENLNIGLRINGSSNQEDDNVIMKYCYDDDPDNCTEYGGLYQWDEMMQYETTPGVQGICPSGWHVPTDAEWTTLTTYLGGESIAGGKMKETGTTHWLTPNTGATNESGFTALPGGYRYYNGDFYSLGNYANFLSSTENSSTYAWGRDLSYSNASVDRYDSNKTNGFSVRCLKD